MNLLTVEERIHKQYRIVCQYIDDLERCEQGGPWCESLRAAADAVTKLGWLENDRHDWICLLHLTNQISEKQGATP